MASKAETIRAIRADWQENTGEALDAIAAEIVLDRMCDAFYEKYYGAGREVAVREMRGIAEYLKWVWLGDDGRGLREAIAKVDEAEAAKAGA